MNITNSNLVSRNNSINNLPHPNIIMKFFDSKVVKRRSIKNKNKKKILNVISNLENKIKNNIKNKQYNSFIKKKNNINNKKILNKIINNINLKKIDNKNKNQIIKKNKSIIKKEIKVNKTNKLKNKIIKLIPKIKDLKDFLKKKKNNTSNISISFLKKKNLEEEMYSFSSEIVIKLKIKSLFIFVYFIIILIFKYKKKFEKIKDKSNIYFFNIKNNLIKYFVNFYISDLKIFIENVVNLKTSLDISIFYDFTKKEISDKKKIINNLIISLFEIIIKKITSENNNNLEKYSKCLIFIINEKNIIPDKLLTEFEINKLKFTYSGYYKNLNKNDKKMIIIIFIIIKVIIIEIFFKINKRININLTKLIYINFFIISNILYISILRNIIKKNSSIEHNIIKPKCCKKFNAMDTKYINFDCEKNFEKDVDIIEGFYNKNQLDYFFSDMLISKNINLLIEKFIDINFDLIN